MGEANNSFLDYVCSCFGESRKAHQVKVFTNRHVTVQRELLGDVQRPYHFLRANDCHRNLYHKKGAKPED